MNINEYLEKNKVIIYRDGYQVNRLTPMIVCADGFSMSVQASRSHYCSPREDSAIVYTSVEIGFPSHEEELILQYAEKPESPTESIYGYVPVEIIDKIIIKHGGIVMQCTTCENEFTELTNDNACPNCGSGSWVFGNIDSQGLM